MIYQTGFSINANSFEDAARLSQRLAPLALAYSHLYLLSKGKYGKLPTAARDQIDGVMRRLAEASMLDVLDFIGQNPYDIPRK